jgi:lipopolysaccharide biosynthesis glycosyltransferase
MAPEDEVVIHIVMSEPLQPKHRKKFQHLEQMFGPKVKIKIYDDEEHVRRLTARFKNKLIIRNWSISKFAKVALPEFLPSSLDKVISLDADVLILSSLRDLWNRLPKEDRLIAGVARCFYNGCDFDDPESENKSGLLPWLRETHLGLRPSFDIHISVVVWDLCKIRQTQRFTNEAVDFMLRYEPPLPAQDTISLVFRDHILPCGEEWNNRAHYVKFQKPSKPSLTPPIDCTAILHCTARPKPWRINPHEVIKIRRTAFTSYISLRPPTIWHKYRQESPWRRSIRSRFRELSATPEDRKLFKPIFTGIAAMLVFTTSVSFYYLGRFFLS